MIALVDGRPETLPLKRLLTEFLDHRVAVIRRRTRYRLKKAEARAHIVEGLLKALDIIDVVIETIRHSASPRRGPRASDVGRLRAAAELDGPGTDGDVLAAAGERHPRHAPRPLTGLERELLQTEFAELNEAIAEYRAILAERARVLALIRLDMEEMIERFGTPRRTQITADMSEVRMEDLIADDAVAVTISHQGYVKRLALSEYRTQGRGGKGVRGADTKEGDFVERIIIATNHQYLLVLTQDGQLVGCA